MRRLRPLSEAECYARCYGGWEDTVRIVRLEPRRARRSWRSKARRCGCVSRSSSTPVTRSSSPSPKQPESAIPDVLAPGLRVLFCGINPGRVSAAAQAHFANPRNDFWRLLHAAGFTPRLLEPAEQFELLTYGIGVTNAAARTTPGSGDLRKADFAGAADRLERIAARAEAGVDRLRRQGGLPRRVRRARRSSECRSGGSDEHAAVRASRRRHRRTPPCRGTERLRWFEELSRASGS